MSKVIRLPTQHPKAPHCPTCEAPLPTFDNFHMMRGFEDVDVVILSITFLVRCKCGAEWNITKKVKT